MNHYDQFSEEQITINLAFNAANINGTTVAKELLNIKRVDLLRNPDNWPAAFVDSAEDAKYSDVDLFQYAGKNALANYCKEISDNIQFPINTCFMHALGVVSSAMNMRFKYDYYSEEKPTNLYVVTAQPPSTGKSGINSKLTNPVREAYSRIMKNNKIFKAESDLKLAKLEKELASQTSELAMKALIKEIEKEQELAKTKPLYRYALDDVTPEALAALAASQNGLFNIISDEADAINILMGSAYGGEKAKTNHGIFLKGWDGDYLSSGRITRDGSEGFVYGSISVIAQDESIDSILEAGRAGRGVSERILMLREKSRLGERKHAKRKPTDQKKKDAYEQLINNIVSDDEKIILNFSEEAIDEVDNYRNTIEPKMRLGGEYANNMICGVVGKADKQIFKIASVLHVCDHWHKSSTKHELTISVDTVIRAILIFNSLINTFIDAADEKGFVGEKTELNAIYDYLTTQKEKSKNKKSAVTIRKLRDSIKNRKEFQGVRGLTDKIKNEYLPELEKRGVLVFNDKEIYISPKL